MGRGGDRAARRRSPTQQELPALETDLTLVGMLRLLDPARPEVAVMLLGPLLGMPLPLLPLQILWMNLVTDGLPALALGVEPAERNIMQRPPYSSSESIFGRGLVAFVVVMGVVMSLISLAIGLWAYRGGDPAWQTLLFTTLIFSQVILALEVRSERSSLFQIGLFTNPLMVVAFLSTVGLQLAVVYVPFLQRIFATAPPGRARPAHRRRVRPRRPGRRRGVETGPAPATEGLTSGRAPRRQRITPGWPAEAASPTSAHLRRILHGEAPPPPE